MKYNIIYEQPKISVKGKPEKMIWFIEAEDAGYASEVGGCLVRGLVAGESLHFHAYLLELEKKQ